MPVIHVPTPPKNASNPDRPISSLLRNQVEHLHIAERRLPPRYQSTTYVNAIKTEGEASAYIRQVTEAIQKAHEEAATRRAVPARPQPKRSPKGKKK